MTTSFSPIKAAAVLALGLALEAGFLLHAATADVPGLRAARAAAVAARPAPAPSTLAECDRSALSTRCG